MDPIFVPSSPEEGSETKRTEAHGRKKWIPFLSRLHPGGGGRKNEARRRRMVGVDALGDPSCANMKQKPCGFREAPAWRARRENGSVFAPRLCPLVAKARAAFLLASTIGGGGTRSVTEGVRLLLLAKRKCCAFCKNSRRNRFHYCLTVFFVI